MEGVPYKAIEESVMSAMVATMVDISFAVRTMSQFISKASPPHWMDVKRIVRYLKGTLDFQLCLNGKTFC